MKVLPVFHWKKVIYCCVQEWEWFLILKAQAWNTPESAPATAEHMPLLIKLTASLSINLNSQTNLGMRGRKIIKKTKHKKQKKQKPKPKQNPDNKSTVSSNKIAVSCPIESLQKKAITGDSLGKMTFAYCLQKMTGDTGSVALWRWRWLLLDFASCSYFFLFGSQGRFQQLLLKLLLNSTCSWR